MPLILRLGDIIILIFVNKCAVDLRQTTLNNMPFNLGLTVRVQ